MKKNIVYIFCDELRQDALGCYGNSAGPMITPNIDQIAECGVLFENCFCNSPVCVPSRTSLLTGLYPEDTAVYHNEAASDSFSMPICPVTFPEVLAQNGYRTVNFGKTHLPRQLHPFELDEQSGSKMNMGLTMEECKHLSKIDTASALHFNLASDYPADKEYGPEHVTKNALSWLRQRHDSPFFLRISYLQPHTPIILKAGYASLYADYPFSDQLPNISKLSEFEKSFAKIANMESLTPQQLRTIKVYYYGLVKWIDDQVGQILTCLKEQGLLENTVLIVNADHGALRGECRSLGKHLFTRCSQSVPLIIADPEMPERQRGQRVDKICSNIDLARTIFGLLGIDAPTQFKGCDLLSGVYPQEVYATIGYGDSDSYAFPLVETGRLPDGKGWPRRACIRTQNYRLDMNVRIDSMPAAPEQEDIFFVDTRRCPAEDTNMAHMAQYAQKVHSLREKLLEHTVNSREVPPETVSMRYYKSKHTTL